MGDFLSLPILGVYCERGHDPSFWAEPVNAVTNAAFVLAGLIAALKNRGQPDIFALALITVVIGVGSFLFHTLATRGAMIADVAPIQAFIALYFFLAMRRLVGLRIGAAALATIAFFCTAALIPSLAPNGEPWRGLAGYAGGLLGLLGLGAWLMAAGRGASGRPILGVACLFAVSLTFRSIDGAVCDNLETGTHPVWHLLNALTLYALMAILSAAPRDTVKSAVT